jgi:2-polyprenyl-3-methyl-5-hydroxy-6-metoxy-1,4-benzoquinol methylase
MASGGLRFYPRWRSYWADQLAPHHREDTPEHYRRYANELALILPERVPRMVLDVGCGNGALFELLGFNHAQYTGIDFSKSMLTAFAQRYPTLRLVAARADEYRDRREYDLIFCNAVVQYFDLPMFDQWLGNATAMLAPDGFIVIGSIPWKTLRLRYQTGELSGGQSTRWHTAPRVIKSWLSDKIGRWYSVREVTALGARHGLRSEIFGSVLYNYRFHVRMSRRGTIGVPTDGP